MTSRQVGRMQSRLEFERFCQGQLYDVTRELNETARRMLRTKRFGSVLRNEEIHESSLVAVEVRR